MPIPSSLCHVLKEDPELADAIPPERRQRAIEDCLAPELRIPPGPRVLPGDAPSDLIAFAHTAAGQAGDQPASPDLN